MWCYFNKTVAYIETNQAGAMSSRSENTIVTFWDSASNQCYTKNIDAALGMVAHGEHCVLAIETQKIIPKDTNIVVETTTKEQVYQLLICNSLGTTVDCKSFNIVLQIQFK